MGIFPKSISKESVRIPALLVAILVTTVLALAYFHYLPWPECPFHKFLHVDCPMCGTTHAVICVLQWKLVAAFVENPIWWLWLFWSIVAFMDLWHRVFCKANSIGERLMNGAMQIRSIKAAHLVLAFSVLAYRNITF
jgi:hypothetical protein